MPTAPSQVLPSKLSAPPSGPFQLERAGVVQRLDKAAHVRLVVLRAPAGFGKTTAMLQHAARLAAQGRATAWLTLDASDDDLGRFLLHLEAALRPVAPASADDPDSSGMLGVMGRAAASTRDFTLFLDDFEAIQNSAVLDLIRQLLDAMPSRWQLVIGSRTVPSLGLGRLRAHGRVEEIGLEHLRFSLDEARRFLRERRGLVLSDDVVAGLYAATEGWVTALWLASVALEGRSDAAAFLKTFSGGNAAITEFLAEDVLAKQPEAVRDFLLRASVLRELGAPVCDAVLQREDSGAMLEALVRANLFLSVADAQARTYRFHSLFADFLRTQLAERSPRVIAELHGRAARWYEAQGRPVPAIEHGLRAQDPALAARLLGELAPALLHSGRFRLLARWLDGLPKALFEAHAMLAVIHAWTLTFTHRHREALVLLEQLEGRSVANGEADEAEIRAHLLALRPLLLSLMDHPDGPTLAIRNHALLDPRHAFPYSLLTNTLASLHAAFNRVAETRVLLEQARRSHHTIGSTFSLVVAECIEGAISLRQGRLQEALTRLRVAMNNMTLEASGRIDGNPNAAVMLAEALYAAGRMEEAERLLTAYMPLVREVGQVQNLVCGYVTLARLAWHRGEPERAFGVLSELEYLGHQDGSARMVASADLERSRLALLRGDTQGAAAYLQRAEHPDTARAAQAMPVVPMHDVESALLGRLRLRLRGGPVDAALQDELASLITQVRAQQRHRFALTLGLLLAEARQRASQAEAARAQMAQALRQALPEGLVQPFADEGPLVAGLAVAWCRTATQRRALPPGVLAEHVDRLRQACAGVAGMGDESSDEAEGLAGAPPGDTTLAESLTFREIHVLKLLARGQSNGAIADALFVSENTVRTHLRNIFSKLGVHNRTEAVNVARQHRLLA